MVYGGRGADRLYGEAGNDTLVGSRGRDELSGGGVRAIGTSTRLYDFG